MFSMKIGVALLLATVVCATPSAVNVPVTASDKLKYETLAVGKSAVHDDTTVANPEPTTATNTNTTTSEPTTTPNTPKPITTLSPNTTVAPSTTTQGPNTTTVAPSTTTRGPNTTTVSPTTISPNTTTVSPTTPSPSTSTHSPNGTTTVAPPPAPTPGRTWDGPSFFGGMVLAFGLVGIGYVGYRFFYLGRGGAYHTL